MYSNQSALVTFSVSDLAQARHFYADLLGLNLDESMPGMIGLKIAGNQVSFYEKKNHTPGNYTLLNLPVDDIHTAISALKQKGVVFEHYDQPDCKTDDEGIVDYGMMKIAFFNDPAGNNHAIVQMIEG